MNNLNLYFKKSYTEYSINVNFADNYKNELDRNWFILG
jgi:hypothetical protein